MKLILVFLVLYMNAWGDIWNLKASMASQFAQVGNEDHIAGTSAVFLPLVFARFSIDQQMGYPRVNVPYFDGDILGEQTAVFWFGQVTPTTNYTDVRIGYNNQRLWVRVSVFDRRLWYDPQPAIAELTDWDAVSLYLDLDGNGTSLDSGNVYRFDAQMNWWEPRAGYQAAYRGTNTGWVLDPIEFVAWSQWWGFPQPNDNRDDRAWGMVFSIPFQSLGLSTSPAQSSHWRLGVQIHDRDDAAGTPIPDQVWPTFMLPEQPITWGRMHFGLPSYVPQPSAGTQTFSLRNGLNGITVSDGVVGGNTLCGNGVEFWSAWGNHSYPGARDVNVQNQGNTDDWPCFSKYYITFPLESLPSDKVIISATLTLHQSGQATGFDTDPPKALNSLIQVFQIGQDWDVSTLSWNNGPLARENVSQAWVASTTELGVARIWDVSRVVARAYAAGEPLRLVLYSADYYGPHGKYFFSATSNDYGGAFRPQLDITMGDP